MVQSIQTILESCISQLSSDSSSYVVQPDKDFTRSRKCSFQQMVSAILNMGGQTLSKELINQDFPISKAAFVQNRYKIEHQPSRSLQKLYTGCSSENRTPYSGCRWIRYPYSSHT